MKSESTEFFNEEGPVQKDCLLTDYALLTMKETRQDGYILSDDYIVFRFATNNLKFGMRADVKGHTISSRVCDLIPELFPQSFNLQLCGHGHISTDFLGFKLWPAKFQEDSAECMHFLDSSAFVSTSGLVCHSADIGVGRGMWMGGGIPSIY